MRLSFFDIRSSLPQNWRELVTPSRQKRAGKYLRNEDRLRCLGAGILLAQELNVSSDDEIILGSWGKPCLRDNRAQFNLSHSGNMVVLAVSDAPIGVDVEQIRHSPLEQDAAMQCFTPKEAEWLQSQRGDAAFFRLWTGKEAIMKATGKGLSLNPASFCILPLENGVHVCNGQAWNMTWMSVDEHMICIAEAARQME